MRKVTCAGRVCGGSASPHFPLGYVEKNAMLPGMEPVFDREILRYRPGLLPGPP